MGLKVIELVGSGNLEEAQKLVSSAVSLGYSVVHLRNFNLSEKESEVLKNAFEGEKIVIDLHEDHDVLAVSKNVKEGDVLSESDLEIKKGQNGLTSDLAHEVVGKKVFYDLEKGTILTFGLIDL